MTPIRANIVGLRNSATGIRLSIAACRRLVARCHARAERTARDLRRRFNFGCTRLQSAAALLDEASADCMLRSEEHTSELQSRQYLVCRLLLDNKKKEVH